MPLPFPVSCKRRKMSFADEGEEWENIHKRDALETVLGSLNGGTLNGGTLNGGQMNSGLLNGTN